MPPTGLEQFLDHAEGLIWNLLDGEISEEGLCELETLVHEHLDVRESCLQCVALHNDLTDIFSETDDEAPSSVEISMPLTKRQTDDSLPEANG